MLLVPMIERMIHIVFTAEYGAIVRDIQSHVEADCLGLEVAVVDLRGTGGGSWILQGKITTNTGINDNHEQNNDFMPSTPSFTFNTFWMGSREMLPLFKAGVSVGEMTVGAM